MAPDLTAKWFRAMRVAEINYNAARRRGLPLPPVQGITIAGAPMEGDCSALIYRGEATCLSSPVNIELRAASFPDLYLVVARALHDCVADALVARLRGQPLAAQR